MAVKSIGGVRVEWKKRNMSNTAWVSVGNVDSGPHFQCDFIGDIEKGPVKTADFAYKPPRWVVKALALR